MMITRSEDIVSEAPCKMRSLHERDHVDGIKHRQSSVTICLFRYTYAANRVLLSGLASRGQEHSQLLRQPTNCLSATEVHTSAGLS